MSNFLTREQFLIKQDLQVEKVDLGNGDVALIRQMTAKEKELFERSLTREVMRDGKTEVETSTDSFRAKLLIRTVCDKDGNLLLKQEDIPTLMNNMTAFRMELIFDAAQKINKIGEDEREQTVKNSESAEESDSNLGSAKS